MDWTRCSRDESRAWLALTLVPGVPGAALRALLARLRSPDAVLSAGAREVQALAGRAIAHALARGADAERVEASLRWLDHDGRHLVALGDRAYPAALLEVDEPPTVLYVVGRLELLQASSVAIVGSRNATAAGSRDAEAFARDLSAAGLTVVSGLALGIDAAAHRGGLGESGSSIAVLGTGADVTYPARNADLASRLARDGVLVSEFPLGTPPRSGNFPRRNRLISGLSRGVIVVEAALRSGSLITARCAIDQGRDVFAIPGSVHSPLSKGCHWLIKEGAKLVECAADVMDEIGCAAQRPVKDETMQRGERDPVLKAMGDAPISLDRIIELTGLEAGRLAARISSLEIDGRVVAVAGGLFQRVGSLASGASGAGRHATPL